MVSHPQKYLYIIVLQDKAHQRREEEAGDEEALEFVFQERQEFPVFAAVEEKVREKITRHKHKQGHPPYQEGLENN